MNPLYLKTAGIALNVLGTLLLTYRVSGVLRAVKLVLDCHEVNHMAVTAFLTGQEKDLHQLINSTQKLQIAHNLGLRLLITGFAFIVIGNLLNIASLWI